MLKLFASCHAVQKIGEKMHGDEVDLKMFQAAGVKLNPGKNGEVFSVER